MASRPVALERTSAVYPPAAEVNKETGKVTIFGIPRYSPACVVMSPTPPATPPVTARRATGTLPKASPPACINLPATGNGIPTNFPPYFNAFGAAADIAAVIPPVSATSVPDISGRSGVPNKYSPVRSDNERTLSCVSGDEAVAR